MLFRSEAAMELLARRWSGLVLTSLMEKPVRFSEIKTAVEGISDRVLSQRLAELEDIAPCACVDVAERSCERTH